MTKNTTLNGCVGSNIRLSMSDAPKGAKPKFKVGDWVYWNAKDDFVSSPRKIIGVGYLPKNFIYASDQNEGFYYMTEDFIDGGRNFWWSEDYFTLGKKPKYTPSQWKELKQRKLLLRRRNQNKRKSLKNRTL